MSASRVCLKMVRESGFEVDDLPVELSDDADARRAQLAHPQAAVGSIPITIWPGSWACPASSSYSSPIPASPFGNRREARRTALDSSPVNPVRCASILIATLPACATTRATTRKQTTQPTTKYASLPSSFPFGSSDLRQAQESPTGQALWCIYNASRPPCTIRASSRPKIGAVCWHCPQSALVRQMIYHASMTLSARSKLLLRRFGLESTARRVVENNTVAAVAGLSSYSYRRNTKDDFHLSLLMSFILNQDSNCIDIGANRGKMLKQMLFLAPNGRHLAFEPIPELADRLRQLFPQAFVHSVALSDSNGTASFSCIVGDEAFSGLSDRHFSGSNNLVHYDVPTARLDDVIPDDFATSFIKIDVEGAEYLVLSGARNTLKGTSPPSGSSTAPTLLRISRRRQHRYGTF